MFAPCDRQSILDDTGRRRKAKWAPEQRVSRRDQDGTRSDEVAGFALWRQVVEGVRHMHTCGVAHLDLKLQNVLLTEVGEAAAAAPGGVLLKLCTHLFNTTFMDLGGGPEWTERGLHKSG